MTRVICAEDCGNSPKRLFLKKFNTALAKGDDAFVLRSLADGVVWERVGEGRLLGKQRVAEALEKMKRERVAELVILNIVTHGSTGAANGTLKLEDGRTLSYSHFYRFSGAKGTSIKEVTAYVVET